MKTKSPLTTKPNRLPGQSLQENVNRLTYDQGYFYVLIALIPWLLIYNEWARYLNPSPPHPYIITVLAGIASAFGFYKLYKVIPEIRNHNRGLSGEHLVGQILERLRAQGFEVFHDVLGEGFNIDHVIIGPPGIFTVETKTFGKPLRGKAIVDYDGQKILMNGVTITRNPIEQAKSQSKWLSKLIQDRTGKRLFIKPIVVFPGWYVTEKVKDPTVLVLNDQRIIPFVTAHEQRMNDSDIKFIAAQLTQYVNSLPVSNS